MSNVLTHTPGCTCLAPTIPLEMADGTVAPVHTVNTRTVYGVRCSADNLVTWWYDVSDGVIARLRFAEVEATCEWPHLLVSDVLR